MAASIRRRGYAATTVADVVRLARTSRRSFYAHFADREECFLALVDSVNDEMMSTVSGALGEGGWEEQADRALTAFLDYLGGEPELFRSFIRELPALGERGATSEVATMRRLARLLVGLVEDVRHDQAPGSDPLAMDVAIIIVGGLRELVVMAVGEGRDVRELHAAAATVLKPVLRHAVLHV